MPRLVRVLDMAFESSEALQHEYVSNLANGGVFIATEETFEPREEVAVELTLGYADAHVQLRGEVVHIVSFEMADVGAKPGVAVQFEGSAHDVRRDLESFLEAGGVNPHQALDPGRRREPRAPARVPAKIVVGEDGPVEVVTRNLSRSGALVSVGEGSPPVGSIVQLTLQDATTGQEMVVDGRVVRQIETEVGDVAAVGVHFEPGAGARKDVDRFVDHLQSVEHARSLGAITGPIEELGAGSLIQMFGRSANEGTLVLRNGAHEASVGFQSGLVCYARVGASRGIDALERLLTWTGGEFEFRAHLEPIEEKEAPLPIEAAVLEAARRLDEARHSISLEFPDDARLRIEADGPGDADGKVEQAVLDLAGAGCTVRRLRDVIPEPDAEIYRALQNLLDEGRIAVGR